MSRVIIILGLSLVVLSCTPETYSYYPAQRRINHKFNTQDSIHIIFPYASFTLIGDGDARINYDHDRARLIEEISNDYLLKLFADKFSANQLDVATYNRDSLGMQFGKMIKLFFNKKENDFSLRANSVKTGNALIFGMDFQLRDYWHWVSISGYHKGGGGHKTRLLVFSYLCLFDLQTGRIIDYKYHFGQFIGGFDPQNQCINEIEFENLTKKNLSIVVKHLLRKSPKNTNN